MTTSQKEIGFQTIAVMHRSSLLFNQRFAKTFRPLHGEH